MTIVTMYAIARNERANCKEWYEAVKEADHVVVLDTGSEDGTADILKGLGVSVWEEKYEEFRFDDARNMSLHVAMFLFPDTDVFITTDLDERISSGWCKLIKRLWDPEKHERISYSHALEGSVVKSSRNWGHNWNWDWLYPCHEVMKRVGSQNDIWYKFENCLDLKNKVTVWHKRDVSKSRDFYLNLLEKRYSEYGDISSLAYLVREYSYVGRWDDIIKLKPDIVKFATDSSGNEPMTCCIYLGKAYIDEPDEARRWLKQAIELAPEFRRPYIELAQLEISQARYQEAIHVLKNCLKKTTYTTNVIFVDDATDWTWRTLDWLGVAQYWAGDYVGALKSHLEAFQNDFGNEHVWNNINCDYTMLQEKVRKWRTMNCNCCK